ncbi:MAG TPA: hypothetical protein VK988_20570, partial [Acidimicrobiales bacterium]|nr:hypothetical protein [Acidimicrobiales bacterium]
PGSRPPAWPVLDTRALHGLAGDIVRAIEPHTEADSAHLLASLLAAFGAAVGPGPHALAGNAQHPARLWVVVVGATAKSRKGTSWATLNRPLMVADPIFFADRVLGGWGSGEAIVDAVRDPRDGEDSAADKRLLIQEGEFARFLKVAARDGSTLSMTARDAWDGARLQARSRANSSVATNHHITLVGHITLEELRAGLTGLDMCSGFANRLLFVLGRQSKRLPEGGNLDDREVRHLGTRLAHALEGARKIQRLQRSAAGRRRWADLYEQMSEDDVGGLLGALTSRDQAQCLRLSVTYALLDGSRRIEPAHLDAAWALWRYCRDSAAYIFGDHLGDEVADRLLAALIDAADDGLDSAAQHRVFGGHVKNERLTVARALLEKRSLVETRTEGTGGRPRVVSYFIAKEAKEAKEVSPSRKAELTAARRHGEQLAHVHEAEADLIQLLADQYGQDAEALGVATSALVTAKRRQARC